MTFGSIRNFGQPRPSKASKTIANASAKSNGIARLPPGWEKKMAPGGREYFIDHTTKTTSWTRPDALNYAESQIALQVIPRQQDEQAGRTFPPRAPQQYDSIEQEVIPEGWEQRESEDGRPYYVNHMTKSTSWTLPH